MITIRKSKHRGLTKTDWLESHHTFSFAEYYDEAFMGFGPLRVINEDTVLPGAGFPKHSHNNMEIISYVISGAMEHKDSMGTGSVIHPGEVQRMSAGAGVQHSEFNHSRTESLHFLQIWIMPYENNIAPSYEQKKIDRVENQWILIVSSEGAMITIHQDVKLYVAYLKDSIVHKALSAGRAAWVQVVKGMVKIDDLVLEAGDGASIENETMIEMASQGAAEVLLFDLVV